MMRCILHIQSHKGFTLIEIIITLVLISITAAIMFPVLGTNLIKSPEPIIRADNQYLLMEEMDKITGTYRDEIEKGNLDISIFKTNTVDTSPYVDAANTQFISSFSDNGGTYDTKTTDSILMVTLKIDDQTLSSIFAE